MLCVCMARQFINSLPKTHYTHHIVKQHEIFGWLAYTICIIFIMLCKCIFGAMFIEIKSEFSNTKLNVYGLATVLFEIDRSKAQQQLKAALHDEINMNGSNQTPHVLTTPPKLDMSIINFTIYTTFTFIFSSFYKMQSHEIRKCTLR